MTTIRRVLALFGALAPLFPHHSALAAPPRLPDGACPSFYQGRVEPDLAVHLWLTRDGGKLAGTYRYTRFRTYDETLDRYLYDDIRLEGELEPGGRFRLTEYRPNREGRERPGGRFEGRFDTAGGIEGVWKDPAGRLNRRMSTRLGGEIEEGEKPRFRLRLEPIAGSEEPNLRGWLHLGGQVYDLGAGCLGQSAMAITVPEFDGLKVAILPGRPELIGVDMPVATGLRSRRAALRLYAPGGSNPLLAVEREEQRGLGATRYEMAYRDSELGVARIENWYGALDAPADGRNANWLAPACRELAGEEVGRFRVARAGKAYALQPSPDDPRHWTVVSDRETLSPSCPDDPGAPTDGGPAAVIRRDHGLLRLEVWAEPEGRNPEAVCWLSGRPQDADPGFPVPPDGAADVEALGDPPLTLRWPGTDPRQAVAVFVAAGDEAVELEPGRLLAFYDRATRTCHHRLVRDPGEWGKPLDEGVFRQRFGFNGVP
jgi:hypothetical protein